MFTILKKLLIILTVIVSEIYVCHKNDFAQVQGHGQSRCGRIHLLRGHSPKQSNTTDKAATAGAGR